MSGLFGVVTKNPCVTDLFYGTDYHSHLGTRRAGISTNDNGVMHLNIHNIQNSYFRTKFSEDLHEMTGNMGIGVISDTDPQPIVVNSHLGRFAVCTVSKINNMDELERECLNQRQQFTELSMGGTNPTELVALLITQGKDFADGIRNVYRHIKGSVSMLILTDKGIIAARDYLGRTPLVIGRRGADYAVASESHSYINIGFQTVRYVGPGEAVLISPDGLTQLIEPSKRMQVCSFLWIYYGYPVAQYEDINAEEVRYQLGLAMGQGDDVEADFVSAIPDSGIGMALGYSAGKGIPYKRGILKYTPTWSRSFMPVNQESRNLVAKMKLIPSRKVLEGKDVVFCDDSIVRGTQLRDQVKMLYEAGVKHIHIRISCPPLIHGCTYLNFSASKTDMELIARRCIEELEGGEIRNLEAYRDSSSKEYATMVEKIRQHVGVDTLKFNSLQTVCDAIGLPKDQVCTHCFDGSSYDISNLEFNQLEMDL
ncbi:MAG: amidophosphoribosyltransferase [Bacteroidales bacterium]|jgi:amidophosphoribosyltransferase|nr:amidophosphoribosyltransferase [Bacteroidales bacterium]